MAKTLKTNPDAEAGVIVRDNSVIMAGNQDNFVQCDNKGTTFSGPLSIVEQLSQVRTGGLWTFNGNLQLSLPSTIATPTPVLQINPPIQSIAGLVQGAAVMIGLMGGFAAAAAGSAS